jgi:hypothetical protein
MSKLGTIFTVSDSTGEITTPAVGTSAFKATAVDGVGVTLAGGALALQTAGASKASGVQRDEVSKYAGARIKGDLADADTGGGIMSVENTYGTDLVIERLILKVDTGTTGACTADFGLASGATTSADGLLDGANMASKGGVSSGFVLDNIDDQGTNGESAVIWQSGYFLTGSMASGAAADLVGTYQIICSDMN